MAASIGSIAFSEKIVHVSHPVDVVLSVINKTQSSGWRRFTIISIQVRCDDASDEFEKVIGCVETVLFLEF